MKVRKLPRRINAEPTKPMKSDLSISIEQSHARQIAELPADQLKVVLTSLREGVRYDDLVAFFAEQGWLTVTEKTFKQYLTAFKRLYPDMLRQSEDEDSLNGLIDPRQPGIDPIAHLEQLVRAQSQRLRVVLDFEKKTGMTMQHGHKEVKIHRETLETLAELKGLTTPAGRPAKEATAATNNVAAQEAIRAADKDEGAQERLVSAMGNLVDLMNRKKKNVAKAKA